MWLKIHGHYKKFLSRMKLNRRQNHNNGYQNNKEILFHVLNGWKMTGGYILIMTNHCSAEQVNLLIKL
jgi:hypothetical protein